MKNPNFWTKYLNVCVCAKRKTATLPSPTPYQATKGLLGLNPLMLSFGNGQTSEGLTAMQTHSNIHRQTLFAYLITDRHTAGIKNTR